MSRHNDEFLTYLRRNDWPGLEELRPKMDDTLARELRGLNFEHIEPRVAVFFTHKVQPEDWSRWGFAPDARSSFLTRMFGQAVTAGRAELFDAFLNAGIDFNSGSSFMHIIDTVLNASKLDRWRKAALVEEIAKNGLDKVNNPDRFVQAAIRHDAPQALSIILTAAKIDVHAGGEWLLRTAAREGNADIARYLVEKHGADIDVAIEKARAHPESRFSENWMLLEEVRDGLRQQSELAQLKQTVRELTARIADLEDPVEKLDKPNLKRPRAATP